MIDIMKEGLALQAAMIETNRRRQLDNAQKLLDQDSDYQQQQDDHDASWWHQQEQDEQQQQLVE
jgi:hypothetical protein